MPCRVQPHIWISDDTLATAYRRFANTCLVNHSHTNTRRHGSSVPGPLEARRRLARRRMAGLSMHGPSPGLMPDLGSLFGSGGLDMTSLWAQPSTAQSRAPSPPHHTPPAPPTPRTIPTPQTPCTSRAVPPPPPTSPLHDRQLSFDEYALLLASCRTLDSLAQAHTSMHSDSDVSQNFSKAAFLSLLHQSTHDQVLAFLQSDLDHQDARNTHAYLVHLFATGSPSDHVMDCVRLVCDKIALGTMPTNELSDIFDVPRETAGIDGRLLLEVNSVLHRSLVDAYAPNNLPERFAIKLLKNSLSLPPSPDVSKLIAAASSLAGHMAPRIMAKHLRTAILSRTRWPGPSDQLMPILSMIPSACFDLVVLLATTRFINRSLKDPMVARSRCIERLHCWLADLKLFYPSIYKPASIGATSLYPFLATKFTIAELGTHLRSLHPADAATIVLHSWIKPSILEVPDPDITESDVPHVLSNTALDTVRVLPLQPPPTVHSRHGAKIEDPFHTYGLRYTMSRSPDRSRTHRATAKERQEIFDSIALAFHERCKPDQNGVYPSRGGAWLHLFTLLSENKIDYAGWLSDLFQVLKQHKSPVWTYHLFAKLTRTNVRIPYPVAVDVMRYFIDIEKTQWALDVFNRSQSHQWLSSLPELLFALTDDRAVRSQAVFDLLKRPDYANSLPTKLRSVAHNPLSNERIQLVHHVAYAMAKSPLLTSRMAFRKVCDCLSYLQDRGAPLSSLMSRALVYAGVTRPLREGIWLSTEKFQWILTFVRRLEGDEVADSLDEAAFTLRSKNLESDKERMKPLDEMERKADHSAWEYRKRFGHGSHRSINVTSPYKTVTSKRTRVQRRLEFAAKVSRRKSK